MPKPMTITVKVEEIAFGKIYRLLDTQSGVIEISYHAEGPSKLKPNGHASGTRKSRADFKITGKDFLLQSLYKNSQPLSNSGVKALFIADGRSGSSPNSILDELKKEGLLLRKPEGYVLSKKARDRLRHHQGA